VWLPALSEVGRGAFGASWIQPPPEWTYIQAPPTSSTGNALAKRQAASAPLRSMGPRRSGVVAVVFGELLDPCLIPGRPLTTEHCARPPPGGRCEFGGRAGAVRARSYGSGVMSAGPYSQGASAVIVEVCGGRLITSEASVGVLRTPLRSTGCTNTASRAPRWV
jgi:hypothetical protein